MKQILSLFILLLANISINAQNNAKFDFVTSFDKVSIIKDGKTFKEEEKNVKIQYISNESIICILTEGEDPQYINNVDANLTFMEGIGNIVSYDGGFKGKGVVGMYMEGVPNFVINLDIDGNNAIVYSAKKKNVSSSLLNPEIPPPFNYKHFAVSIDGSVISDAKELKSIVTAYIEHNIIAIELNGSKSIIAEVEFGYNPEDGMVSFEGKDINEKTTINGMLSKDKSSFIIRWNDNGMMFFLSDYKIFSKGEKFR